MAKISWKGSLYYEGTGVGVENNNFTRTKLSGTVTVKYFYADGGPGKAIHLDSTVSLPVWSEFDQAKKNNNIIFGLSLDVTAASHFTTLSKIEFPLSIVFSVIGSGSNVYNLRTEKAFFVQAPRKEVAYGETVTFVKFKISDCELIQGLMGMKIQSGVLKIKL